MGDKSSLRKTHDGALRVKRDGGWRERFALAVTAVVLAACGPAAPPAPPKPHVSVAYPLVKQVIDWDDFIGRFQAIQDVTVMPRVSGAITTVLFKNGQDVKAGQPLFIIDPRPFRAAYDQAVGELDQFRRTYAAQSVDAREIGADLDDGTDLVLLHARFERGDLLFEYAGDFVCVDHVFGPSFWRRGCGPTYRAVRQRCRPRDDRPSGCVRRR